MEKSEIEIINDKVSAIIKATAEQEAKNERILEKLKKNQNYFYHWQNLERIMGTGACNGDENAFAYIEKNLPKGILEAVLRKYIPKIKEELNETIERQIQLLTPPQGGK